MQLTAEHRARVGSNLGARPDEDEAAPPGADRRRQQGARCLGRAGVDHDCRQVVVGGQGAPVAGGVDVDVGAASIAASDDDGGEVGRPQRLGRQTTRRAEGADAGEAGDDAADGGEAGADDEAATCEAGREDATACGPTSRESPFAYFA